MDPQTQASFIPKKPLVSNTGKLRPTVSIAWVLALLIFLGSIAAAGLALGYRQYLERTLQSQADSLQKEQAAFDPRTITGILTLDQRMHQAHKLLQSHIAPLALFTYLEENTLANVRFSNFSYQSSSGGSIQLSLTGEARDFSSVALQSDQFDATSTPLSNVLFSGINIDPATGHVGFKVSAVVDPALISFEKSPAATAALGTSSPPANTAASSTSNP